MLIHHSAVESLRRPLALTLIGAASCAFQASHAEGTFIPAPSRADIVHDAPRNLLYITSGDSVLRYDLGTNSFLSPFLLGGALKGMDLSPNGNTLVVADYAATTGSESWVYVVDLATGSSNKSLFPRAFYEAGTYAVAFGNDGSALVTSNFAGSGSVPLRKFDPDTNTWTTLATINQRTMATSSGDGSVIGFAESNSSGGPFGRYRVVDGNLVRKWPTGGTNWFNYEIGVNHDGTQFAIPTYGGTFIYDASLTKIATIGQYAGQQPVGVAYHPVESVVYFAWSQGTNVTAHETAAFSQVATYNFENTNGTTGNWAFVNGRLKLSRDGSLLFSTVTNGVRYVQLYAPLTADSLETTIDEDDAGAPITLSGSIGNGGTLSYLVLTPPEHGTLTGTPPNLTYTPDANFNGTDSFTFGVDYGQAGAEGSVSITVNSIEDAPIATAQAIATDEDTARTITLSGSDAENSPLTYSIVTTPAHGTLSGAAPNVTYTPDANYSGPDSFSFKVNDGSADSAPANVAVTVTPINDAPVAFPQEVATNEDTESAITLSGSDIDSVSLGYSIVTAPAHGTLTGVLPNVTYTPDANYSGPDSFSFKVNDGSADSTAANVAITVASVNDAPVATNDTATTIKNTAVNINVLANDSDADADALVVTSTTQSASGSIEIINGGTAIKFTPKLNYFGTAAFTYTISDGHGGSATATVQITVNKK